MTVAGLVMAVAWISGGSAAPESGAPLLSRSFMIPVQPTNAVLTYAVDGWCEARVNGHLVSDAVLSPVVCQPDKRVSSLSHDIAAHLIKGTNVVSFLLGNGWKNTFTIDTWGFHKAPWRGAPQVSAMLVADGKVVLETDGRWQAEDSPVIFNALRNGEWYDARREGQRIGVRSAKVEKYAPWGEVSPEDAVPCRAVETLKPVRTLSAPDGAMVYDFGVNIAGWCEIDVRGEAGAMVTLDYDESLTSSNAPLGYVGIYMKRHGEPRPVQHDEYTLAGRVEGESWHPRFAYHGFRYVQVKLCGKVELKAIRARFVHSDFARSGTLTTSDPVFAQLQDATLRSYLSNFVGIPTDCPHREKNGWTGDAQLACETGLWNFKAKDGYVHFLRMMLDAQLPNGAVPCILPCCPTFGYGWGSGPAWDAALFVIPRQIYRFTGDDRPAQEAYGAMKRYLDFIGEKVDEDGLVDYGLGDWCYGKAFTKPTPTRLTDSAWVYHFNCELSLWARHFGEPEVAADADARAAKIRSAFNKAFWHRDGMYADGQLTALAAPLYFKGLCAEGDETNVVRRLVESVRIGKHRAHFGILGAKWVPRVLVDYGYVDDAWKLFTQAEMPGWAHWLKSGYGSLMENWDMTESRNHIMFGDLSAWAYEYVVGIVPVEPGLRKIMFKPHYPRGVESFSATYDSPYGKITAGWSLVNGEPRFECSVPREVEVVRSALDEAGRIELGGSYPGHLQDVCMDGETIWWAHTQNLIKTDRAGKVLVRSEVGGHHAGLEIKDGRLFSAVCAYNGEPREKTTPQCHVMVGEYDAEDLSLIAMHVLDINDRAGSFCILPDGTYLIGCLRHPALRPSEVKFHHVGRDFKLIGTHVVDVGMPVELGIEVIRRDGDDLYLFVYNAPVVRLDAKTFSVKGRYRNFGGSKGFVREGGFAWIGVSERLTEGGPWKSRLERRPIVWEVLRQGAEE